MTTEKKTKEELESMTVAALRKWVVARGWSFPYLGETPKREIVERVLSIQRGGTH